MLFRSVRLTGTHGLDDDRREPRDIQQVDHRAGRARQAARIAARGQRPDENAVVGAEFAHPDAIAEHGAAGARAGGIDRHDRDALPACQQLTQQRIRSEEHTSELQSH